MSGNSYKKHSSGKIFVLILLAVNMIIFSASTAVADTDYLIEKRLSEHTGFVRTVSWSPDGSVLVSSSRDETIIFWNTESWDIIETLEPSDFSYASNIEWSPDGNLIAWGHGNNVTVWDVDTMIEVSTLSGHTGYISSLAWSSDGKYLASGSADGNVTIWDATSWSSSSVLNVTDGGYGQSVTVVSFSNDDSLLVTGTFRGEITVWDTGTWAQTASMKRNSHNIPSLAWFPDGSKMATAHYDEITIWDTSAWTEIITIEGSGSISTVACSNDGTRIMGNVGTLEDWGISIWDTTSWGEIDMLEHSGGYIYSFDLSKDDKVAAGTGDEFVIIWSEDSGVSTPFLSNGLIVLTLIVAALYAMYFKRNN